jgi:aminoglycoside 3-N-acetyltransferase
VDVDRQRLPHTPETIEEDLRAIGLYAGDTVLVHSSLKQIGYAVGGPHAIIQALMNVVTDVGTVVMPAFTTGYSDPMEWKSPPAPQGWADVIRANLPPFDAVATPSEHMGVIAELFRGYPEVRRNTHPVLSYAAWGTEAESVVTGHTLEMMDGENSPLARIYDLDGKVLLIGVDYDSCTSIHLATHRQVNPPMTTRSLPSWDEMGRISWNRYRDVLQPPDLVKSVILHKKVGFNDIGAEFEATGAVKVGRVGNAESRFFTQLALVDFATEYFNRHPYADAALGT